MVQVSLPSDGRGAKFPVDFAGIGANDSAADSIRAIAGLSAATTPVDQAFTIELFANLDDLSANDIHARSVLVAQVTNPWSPGPFGWAFVIERDGIAAAKAGDPDSEPQELELFASDGETFWHMPSGILIDEQTDYYLAASFDINADVRFYVKNLANGRVETSNIDHSLPRLNPDPFLQIVAPYNFGFVDGVLDEVRLSNHVLSDDELLISIPDSSAFVRQPGDANQDRRFNTDDIIQVAGAGKFGTGEPATWAQGYWDGAPNANFTDGPPAGDGLFNSRDIIAALGAGLFETGPYAAVSSSGTKVNKVPEPSACILAALSFIALLAIRRGV